MISKVAIVALAGVLFLPAGGYARKGTGVGIAISGRSHKACPHGLHAESIRHVPLPRPILLSERERDEKEEERPEEKQQRVKDPKGSMPKASPTALPVPSEKIKADQAVDFPYDI